MKIAAWDLDETLLEGDSDLLFIRHCETHGLMDASHASRAQDFYDDYHAGKLDLAAFYDYTLSPFAGRTRTELEPLLSSFHAGEVFPRLRPAMVERLCAQRAAGWRTVLVTATNQLLGEPVARHLGMDGCIATEVAREAGRFTGAVAGEPAYRDGKRARLESWLARRGTSLDELTDSTYHGDSTSDLPLLERVRRPVAVTPSDELRAIAETRGWEIHA